MIRDARGFTLIEMIIVIAVMGILSAIAVPGFGAWLDDQRLNNAANMIRGDLNRAKITAAKNKRQYRVLFGTSGYELQEGDKRSASTTWTGNILNRSFADYPGVTVKSVSTHPVFNPRGTVDSAVTITLENIGGNEQTIEVSYAGRVKTG